MLKYMFVLFLFFLYKKEKKIVQKKTTKKTYAKNLTFQMQRCKQTALTLQSTRLHSITKRINMEDSQRPTRRTKTWFYPIFKCNKQTKKTTKNKHQAHHWFFCFLRIHQGKPFSFSVFKTFNIFPVEKPRPAPCSAWSEENKVKQSHALLGTRWWMWPNEQ